MSLSTNSLGEKMLDSIYQYIRGIEEQLTLLELVISLGTTFVGILLCIKGYLLALSKIRKRNSKSSDIVYIATRQAGNKSEFQNYLEKIVNVKLSVETEMSKRIKKANLSTKHILKEVKSRKSNFSRVICITGEPGSGKTSMVMYLAYNFMLDRGVTNNKYNIDNSVRYIDFSSEESIGKFADNIKNTTDANILVVDAIDEFFEIKAENQAIEFKKFITTVENALTMYDRVFFTTRTSLLLNLYDDISQLKLKVKKGTKYDEVPITVLRILPLRNIDMIRIYRYQSSKRKVRLYLEFLIHSNTIFRNPVFIEYANDIFDITKSLKKKKLNNLEVVKYLVELWINREYSIFNGTIYETEYLSNIPKEEFVETLWLICKKIADKMLEKRVPSIKIKEVKSDIQNIKLRDEECIKILTRSMFKYVNNNRIEYVHKIFFDYFIGLVLSEKKYRQLKNELNLYEGTSIHLFYVYEMINKYGAKNIVSAIDCVEESDGHVVFIEEENDLFQVSDCEIHVSGNTEITIFELIMIFPTITGLYFHGFYLNKDDIDAFMEKKLIKSSSNRGASIIDIDKFGEGLLVDLRGKRGIIYNPLRKAKCDAVVITIYDEMTVYEIEEVAADNNIKQFIFEFEFSVHLFLSIINRFINTKHIYYIQTKMIDYDTVRVQLKKYTDEEKGRFIKLVIIEEYKRFSSVSENTLDILVRLTNEKEIVNSAVVTKRIEALIEIFQYSASQKEVDFVIILDQLMRKYKEKI